MKLLILEGIATSGKSTVIARIQEQLHDLSVRVATELETHEPIMKQTDELHAAFFEDLVRRLVAQKPDLLVFDRLYLTQAFRAGVSLEQYAGLEAMLVKLGAVTVFLKVSEDAIAARVAKAAGHRDPSWGEYIKTKGEHAGEIADYYIAQQRSQLRLLETSSLPYVVCDTTSHDYPGVTELILERLQLS